MSPAAPSAGFVSTSPAPPTTAEEDDEEDDDSSAAEMMTEFAEALEEATLQREVDVQKVAAYWLDVVASLKAKLAETTSPAGATGAIEAAEARALEAEKATAAAELKAEVQLQSTAAFWIARERAMREKCAALEAANAELMAAAEDVMTNAELKAATVLEAATEGENNGKKSMNSGKKGKKQKKK